MIKNAHREAWAGIIGVGVTLLLVDAFFLQNLDSFANLCWFLYLLFTAIVLYANKR